MYLNLIYLDKNLLKIKPSQPYLLQDSLLYNSQVLQLLLPRMAVVSKRICKEVISQLSKQPSHSHLKIYPMISQLGLLLTNGGTK